MNDIRTFEFDKKKYEVQLSKNGLETSIRVFLEGKPANGYSYSVDLEVMMDAKSSKLLFDPLEDMINTAINDVKEKKWEQYLNALEFLK